MEGGGTEREGGITEGKHTDCVSEGHTARQQLAAMVCVTTGTLP